MSKITDAGSVMRKLLEKRAGPVPAKELIAAAVSAGFGTGIAYSAVFARTRANEFIRTGKKGAYSYSLDAHTEKRAPETSAPRNDASSAYIAPAMEGGPLAPGLGVICKGAGKRVNTNAADLRTEIEACLDDEVAFSLDEIVDRLGGFPLIERRRVAQALSEGVMAGWLATRFDREERANVYWLCDERSVADATALPAPAPPVERPLLPGLRPAVSLRDRFAAIGQDIEDAIVDACDARAPHAVIKAIAQANGSMRRALRELVP